VPVLCVVPARLGSSRLPRKPLLPLAGEPLILWVVRRVVEAGIADRLVVATDAREIAAVVEQAGYEAAMTSPDHQSGTERVSEAVASKTFNSFDVVLNVQGDEPLVARAALEGAVARVRGGDPIGTAAGDLNAALAADPNRVKVVRDARGRALEHWVRLPPVAEERWERLEQLRPLVHGIPIGVALFPGPAAPGVDTADDLRYVEAQLTRHLREVSP